MFDFVDRYHELEDLRRSLAMLPPRSAGLEREDAMALTAELQGTLKQLRKLRAQLLELAAGVSDDR